MSMVRAVGDWVAEKLTLLGALSWSLLSRSPQRLGRIGADAWHAVTGPLGWLRGPGNRGVGTWLSTGLTRALVWCGRLLVHLAELAGLGEALQLLWGLAFRLRRLTPDERAASASVYPSGLISHWQVRVDDDSRLITIGVVLARLLKTKVSPGAITTMHIVHAPAGGLGLPLAVHELTHVAQYQKVGASYIPEALRAQGSHAGYDYGELTGARASGRRFADFNREQQAAICADYYRVRNGMPAEFGATEAQLAPFVADLRSGEV